jgi:hypothetical protein
MENVKLKEGGRYRVHGAGYRVFFHSQFNIFNFTFIEVGILLMIFCG